jgi:hypothetical protein
MQQFRTTVEALSDAIITLLVLRQLTKYGRPRPTRLEIQRICFHLARLWHFQGRKGLNFRFYRYASGIFSPDLDQALTTLEVAGLIECRQYGSIVLTELGQCLGHALWQELCTNKHNKPFLEDLAAVIKEPKTADFDDGAFFRKFPIGSAIAGPLDSEKASSSIEIPESWLEVLAASTVLGNDVK